VAPSRAATRSSRPLKNGEGSAVASSRLFASAVYSTRLQRNIIPINPSAYARPCRGHARGIPVGVCGEAAADSLFIPFLVGVGIDELSVAAAAVLSTKEAVGKCARAEAAGLAEKLLQMKSAAVVKEALAAFGQGERE